MGVRIESKSKRRYMLSSYGKSCLISFQGQCAAEKDKAVNSTSCDMPTMKLHRAELTGGRDWVILHNVCIGPWNIASLLFW